MLATGDHPGPGPLQGDPCGPQSLVVLTSGDTAESGQALGPWRVGAAGPAGRRRPRTWGDPTPGGGPGRGRAPAAGLHLQLLQEVQAWEELLGGRVSLAGLGWASMSWARGGSEVWGSEGVVLLGPLATRRGADDGGLCPCGLHICVLSETFAGLLLWLYE